MWLAMHPVKKAGALVLLLAALAADAIALAVVFGGPGEPAPMASISAPFKQVDFSDLPRPSRFAARDGVILAFRAYPAAQGPARGSVVLVHGSSAGGASLHVLAKALAAAGYAAYALDVRGHGDSGRRGTIGYVGQLEDDLDDFMAVVRPAAPATLAGFSSGGGFALRYAADARQKRFANYLLLSPFLSPQAPTFRPDAGGWVKVGVPRIVGISLLNAVGLHFCDGLAVTRFAIDPAHRDLLTPSYSYALALNFQPRRDYRAAIRAAKQPMALVAGQSDEVFFTDRFAGVFQAEGKALPIRLLPGIGHIALTLDPAAVRAAVEMVGTLDATPSK